MLNKQQEKVLKYILSLERKATNETSIDEHDYSLDTVSIEEFISCIHILEQLNMIRICWHSTQKDDIKTTIDITILPDGMNYFDNKKSARKQYKRDWIKTYIPITISFVALLKSFQPEITVIVVKLLNIIKQLLK